jgi:hypothetical protein
LERLSTSALSLRQNFSGSHSGFSVTSGAGASVRLAGAPERNVPSVVTLALAAGAVDAGTAALSAVVLVWEAVVVASVMVVGVGWLVF